MRVLEFAALSDGGPPGDECPFPGDSSVWFRILDEAGQDKPWIESDHRTRKGFLADLPEWWGGDSQEWRPR